MELNLAKLIQNGSLVNLGSCFRSWLNLRSRKIARKSWKLNGWFI